MKPTITLLFDPDCPNVDTARANLRAALAARSLPITWEELDLSAADTPQHLKALGSPTVLVDGVDVAAAPTGSEGACCRLYGNEAGQLLRAPTAEMIAEAIAGRQPTRRSLWGLLRSWTSLPGAGASLMPVAVCPACLPVYAGFLSAVGLGFLMRGAYLLPLMAVLLAAALAGLGYRARRRRGYGPLALGTAAAGAILAGKFLWALPPAVYGGVGLLLAASLWNAWPRKTSTQTACPSCAPAVQADPERRAQNQ